MYYSLINSMNKGGSGYLSSLKLFIDAGNPLSYSGSGTTVTDLIGTQNGTLTNGVGYSSSNGGYFTFDGVNDYIDFGINTVIQSANSRTVSVWVNYTNQGFAFSDYNPSTGLNGVLILKDSTTRGFLCTNTGNARVGATTISTNTWYYTTFSFDSTSMAFYLNGVLISTTPVVNQGTVNPPYSVLNGVNRTILGDSYPSAFPLNGKIAQLKIYENKLSDAEVLTDFNEFKSRYGY